MQAPTPDDAPRRTLGQVLSAERERQGLSRADAAQRLHMSAYQIEALEAGDYSRLPKGTFLRGFVRNYAKVLGLKPDDVLPLLTEVAPPQGPPGIVVPTQNIRFDPLGDRLQNPYVKAGTLAFVAVAVALAAMYWFLFIRPAPPAGVSHRGVEPTRTETPANAAPPVVALEPAATPPAAEPPKAEPVVPAEVPKAEAPARKPESTKAAPAKAETAPKVAAVKPAATGESSVLRFRFHGESWVEIRDARGKLLFSKLNPAGSETEVAGTPPLNVIVGNAPEVQLFYNDHEFDLEPHTKVAVARFTVE